MCLPELALFKILTEAPTDAFIVLSFIKFWENWQNATFN